MRYPCNYCNGEIDVSIHAPARGAIYKRSNDRDPRSFNSRTREGCDLMGTVNACVKRFQFTHPRGVRLLISCPRRYSKVSIHAPARGAMTCNQDSQAYASFNSRTREGCDPTLNMSGLVVKFQFTHPRGVRLRILLPCIFILVSIHAPARGAIRLSSRSAVHSSFNSRTREGCDVPLPGGGCAIRVSIHAPARGAMPTIGRMFESFGFQFTHPRGVR